MSTENDQLILILQEPSGVGIVVHHRDFPEIRANGANMKEGATQLSNHLTRALDSALTKWRREAIEQAISDVKSFAASAQ